jgi:hypothetical protein
MLRTGLLGLAFGLAFGLAHAFWVRSAPPPVIVIAQAPPLPQPPQHQASPPPGAPLLSITFALPEPRPPVPPPKPPTDPAPPDPCPAPFTAATFAELDAPPDIRAITLSRHDVRLLAMWSDDALHLSTDEGQSFTRVLDRAGTLGDVAFDCRGRLHALRGDGELGTYDPQTRTERWARVATFWSRGDEIDAGRLIADGAGVAVIGNTPARRDRLWLARRDPAGRWQARHLFSDREPGYWSGIGIGPLRLLPDRRIQMMVTPNMADFGSAECGYSKVFEVIFDLDARRIATRDRGEGGAQLDDQLQQDAAGRWLLLLDGHASRLTTEELVQRLAPAPASPAP